MTGISSAAASSLFILNALAPSAMDFEAEADFLFRFNAIKSEMLFVRITFKRQAIVVAEQSSGNARVFLTNILSKSQK